MSIFRRSLRNRFFLSLITLVFLASILIAGVTIYQVENEAKHYQENKLEQKVASIEASIRYQIENTTYPLDTQHIPLIFKDEIYEISHIHDTPIKFYNLEGRLLKSSRANLFQPVDSTRIPNQVLLQLKESPNNRFSFRHKDAEGNKVQSSYSYVTDSHFKPLAILSLPSIKDDGFMEKELKDFLIILGQVYLFVILVGVVLSFLFSRYITRSLNTVSQRIYTTRLDKANKKVNIKKVPLEITGLAKAYNSMVEELDESAKKLASSEREQAWRDMAKQVAHEVKNPLTPMRLAIQSFHRKFNAADPKIDEKVKVFSQNLIGQIDNLSAIASAFSDFAKMPQPKDELLNIPEEVQNSLEIFKGKKLHYKSPEKEIWAKFDRNQLIRIITNLVKNAFQAGAHNKIPNVEVKVTEDPKNVIITVSDDGKGIPKEIEHRIFEPKFTTKSSGSGLGLGIIKKIIEIHNGNISFQTQTNKGTTFKVKFPKNNN